MGKIIGVVSLKGGAGKTSVVASLGSALSEIGKKVLLIDGNLSSPSLGLHFNILSPEKTLHHVLNMNVPPREAIYDYGKFHVMPSSIFEKIEVNPLKLKDRIRNLRKSYDVILIDSSPSLNEETLAVMLASDEILAVTTPDHAALSATIKAVKLAKQRGTPISGLVINKVHNKNFEVSLKDVEETLELPVLAVIPYDINFLRSLANMESYITAKPNSKGSIEYKKLAATLMGEKYNQPGLMGFFGRMTPSRQEINRELFYQRMFK